MKQIITSETGLTFDNAKSYATGVGLLAAGFLVAHNGLRLVKMQDKVLANLGLTAVAVVGAMSVSNPLLKLLLVGVAAYSGVKTLSLSVAEVAAPGKDGAAGLSGFIPEGIKSKVRAFLPTFGEVDGAYDEFGTDELNAISLDEPMGEINPTLLMGETDPNLGDIALIA